MNTPSQVHSREFQPTCAVVSLASGNIINLMRPTRQFDWSLDIALPLSRIPRFVGQTADGLPYSVAQHCCEGADAILDQTGDSMLAGQFLLHDAHEALIGDFASPVMAALVLTAQVHALGSFSPRQVDNLITGAVTDMKSKWDHVIYRKANIPRPTGEAGRLITEHDQAMLEAERLDLFPAGPARDGPQWRFNNRSRGTTRYIKPWPANKARQTWLAMLKQYVPA